MFGLELYEITQAGAAAIAFYGMVFGLGMTAFMNYWKGRSQLPAVYIWNICLPMTIAMLLRATTFLLSPVTFWFFFAVDIVAALINLITIGQHFGLFLRKQKAPV